MRDLPLAEEEVGAAEEFAREDKELAVLVVVALAVDEDEAQVVDELELAAVEAVVEPLLDQPQAHGLLHRAPVVEVLHLDPFSVGWNGVESREFMTDREVDGWQRWKLVYLEQ